VCPSPLLLTPTLPPFFFLFPVCVEIFQTSTFQIEFYSLALSLMPLLLYQREVKRMEEQAKKDFYGLEKTAEVHAYKWCSNKSLFY
jgi:hypothetical protein